MINQGFTQSGHADENNFRKPRSKRLFTCAHIFWDFMLQQVRRGLITLKELMTGVTGSMSGGQIVYVYTLTKKEGKMPTKKFVNKIDAIRAGARKTAICLMGAGAVATGIKVAAVATTAAALSSCKKTEIEDPKVKLTKLEGEINLLIPSVMKGIYLNTYNQLGGDDGSFLDKVNQNIATRNALYANYPDGFPPSLDIAAIDALYAKCDEYVKEYNRLYGNTKGKMMPPFGGICNAVV